MTFRQIQVANGRVPEAVSAAIHAVGLLNERYGSSYGVATQIGGDPNTIGASSGWESLADYEAFRAAAFADPDVAAAMALAAATTTGATDAIGRVLLPAGERGNFTLLNTARMHMPRAAEAIPFGLEVAEFVQAKRGTQLGFGTAVTGDRSVTYWFSYYDSLDAVATDLEALEADPEYMDMYKRAEGLYVDGSVEQAIWQRVV